MSSRKMSITIEDCEEMSDDSSVIFLSDVSEASDNEDADNSRVNTVKDIVKEEFIVDKSTLQPALQLEISAEKSGKSVVTKFDKHTQTYEHDFPIIHVPQVTPLPSNPVAQFTSDKNLLKHTQEPAKRCQITFDTNKTKHEIVHAHTRRENWKNGGNCHSDRRESRPYISTKNNYSDYYRRNDHKTWDQKRNMRYQPYIRRNNYNVWDNPPNNYYGRNNSSYNYQQNYSNNNYNRQLDNYNRYGITTYNSPNHWGVQYYTYSFKQRVFNGFIRYMNFVYQYNHS